MDIMVSLQDAKHLEHLKRLDVTHILLNDESFSSGVFGLDPIKLENLIQRIHGYGMKAIIRVDRLYDQSELQELKAFLKDIDSYHADGVLFSDITIKVLVEKLGLDLQTIYAPETLLTNQYDVSELKNDHFSSCVISKDIPLEDVYDIARYNPGYCYIRVHGPILISYSKRRFISVYLGEKKEYREHYYLQEESRDSKLPIVEKDKGTWTYGFTLQSFEDIEEICQNDFKGIIIDNIFEEDDYIVQVTELYHQVLQSEISGEEALQKAISLNKEITYTGINEIRRTSLEKE